jgi:tetratricopeptide (TPR) repeat protein
MYRPDLSVWRKPEALALALGLALLGACFLSLQAGCGQSPRSLVLVTVDGLRADHVDAEKAPQWSALASQGTRLDSLYTTVPSNVPALASLMTGKDPDDLEAFFGDVTRLPEDVTTMAEVLKENGYKTTAYVGEGSVARSTGIARGFDTFVSPSGPLRQAFLSTEPHRAKPRHSGLFSATDVIEMVGRHLRKQTLEDRFFVWVHLGDLDELGALDDPSAAYLEILTRVDRVIGDLEDALVTYGLSDRTLLAATSIYGVSLGEGGERGHGLALRESVVRVPGFLRGPGADTAAVQPGSSDGEPASLSGLRARILSALGIEQRVDAEPGLVFVGTRLPSRQYGWSDRAAVGGPEGWLRLDPRPAWYPLGTEEPASRGPEAFDAAPASYRERLERAGFLPASEASDVEESKRREALRLIADAHTHMSKGKVDSAIRMLRDAGNLLPSSPGPRSAVLMLASGLPQDLRDRFRAEIDRAIEELRALSGDSFVRQLDLARGLALVGRCGDSLEIVRSLAQRGGRGEKLALASLAGSCRDYEQAAALLEDVAAGAEKTPELDEWRGDVLAAAGNAFQAKEAYQSAFQAGREDPGLVAKLGDQLAELGELDAALEHYAKAQQLDPSYRYPHERAAEVFLRQGKLGAAAHAIVLSVPSRGDPVRDALLRARALAGRELYDAALMEVEKGMSEAPGNLRLEIRHARILTDADRLEEAAAELTDLRERAPRDPRVLVESARLAAKQGSQNEAIAYLEAAEPQAGAPVTRLVRRDPVFRRFGAESPLAAAASRFTGQIRPGGAEQGDAAAGAGQGS